MANKVFICGINTSLLPKPKGKEIAELMSKLKKEMKMQDNCLSSQI